MGCSPWGHEESDTTEQLHFPFSLSCIGEGNPLQCSCLENPRDGGAWWAPVYGVAQSRTRLKRLSSNSSSTPDSLFSLLSPYSFFKATVVNAMLHQPLSCSGMKDFFLLLLGMPLVNDHLVKPSSDIDLSGKSKPPPRSNLLPHVVHFSMTNQHSSIKAQSPCPNLGQFQRTIPASENPVS